jgi:hypothetical protein
LNPTFQTRRLRGSEILERMTCISRDHGRP